MLTMDEMAGLARRLEGVRETARDGLLRWQVAGRLVARQLDADSVVVRSGFAERERLVLAHPRSFTVPPRFEAHMMVVVELRHADRASVEQALHQAWQLQTG